MHPEVYAAFDRATRGDVACAPCHLPNLASCRQGHACMRSLMPATVIAAAERLLAQE